MMAAAAAWDALAVELSGAAAGYRSVVDGLTDYWLGPASSAMATAAAPYITWLHRTSAVAEQIAAQAKAAAAAYELAFAMTVPPPVIAANRTLLSALVATNFFGQNTAAIAATEAHYAEMWSQDATAMYNYAGSSATACQLTPFAEPRPTTNPVGLANQSDAVVHAAGNAIATATQSTVPSQPLSAIPGVPQEFTDPTAIGGPLSSSTLFITGLSATKVVNTVMSTTSSAVSGRGILIATQRLLIGGQAAEEEGEVHGVPPSTGRVSLAGTAVPTVSVVTGRAVPVGKLSVPASWATALPGIQPPALSLPTFGAAPVEFSADLPDGSGNVLSQSILGTLSRDGPDRKRHRSKPIIVRSPAAG